MNPCLHSRESSIFEDEILREDFLNLMVVVLKFMSPRFSLGKYGTKDGKAMYVGIFAGFPSKQFIVRCLL